MWFMALLARELISRGLRPPAAPRADSAAALAGHEAAAGRGEHA
jgi:hypothetical protein